MVEKKKKSSTKGSSPIIDEKELFEKLKSQENNAKENQAYELEQPNVVKKIRRNFFITLAIGFVIIISVFLLFKDNREPLKNVIIIQEKFYELKPEINKELKDFKLDDVKFENNKLRFSVKNKKEINSIKLILKKNLMSDEYSLNETQNFLTVSFQDKFFIKYKDKSTGSYGNILSTILLVVLMFYYFLLAGRVSKTPIATEVTADSCYYLGFLFTFFTLFMVVTFGDESSKLIIKHMGVALFTTVVGLSMRIYLSQFNPIGNESEKDIQKTLASSASNIIDTSTKFQKNLDNATNELNKVTGELNKVGNVLNMQIANVDLKQFEKTLDPFKNSIGGLNVELEKIRDDTTRISNEISNSANSLNSLTLTLDKLRTVSDQTEQVVEDFKESNNKLKENQMISNENLELINQKVQSVSESLEKNTSTIEKSSYQVEASTKQFSDASGRMVEETLKIETSMKQKLINLIDFLKK